MTVQYDRNINEDITNYYLEAARGNVVGVRAIHRFGLATNIDAADGESFIWTGMSDDIDTAKIPNYTFSSTADITDIASSDNSDTVDIKICGLDENWDHVEQVVTLTGQTVAELSTPLIRVCEMYNVGATDLAGNIYLTTDGAARTLGVPDVTSTIRSIITDGDNQSAMAITVVPAGHNLLIDQGWASIASTVAGYVSISIWLREFGGVFRRFHTLTVGTSGSSSDHRPYNIPLLLPEKTDLIYKAVASTVNMAASAGFHGLIIKD